MKSDSSEQTEYIVRTVYSKCVVWTVFGIYNETVQYVQCVTVYSVTVYSVTVYSVTVYSTYCGVTLRVYMITTKP